MNPMVHNLPTMNWILVENESPPASLKANCKTQKIN